MSAITVSDLTFCYPGSYDPIFEHMSFVLDTDWKLGFVGRNGRGKTTFLKLLMGEYAYSGRIDASVRFDYFPFPVETPETPVLELAEALSGAREWEIRRELGLLAVPENALDRPFSTLSMGERTKVLLAALFLRPHNFLLIDEPTNHLDMPARQKVSRYLAGKRGFLLVSHDRAFLDGCVDHILSINRASIEVRQGNYSAFAEQRRRQDAFELSENEKLQKQMQSLRAAAERAESWSERAESERIGGKPADRGYVGHKAAKMMKRGKNIARRAENAAKEKEQLLKNVERNDALRAWPLTHHAELLVEARKLVIRYDGRDVTPELDFTVRRGERLALTGKNGAGKSSVVRLLTGEPIAHGGVLRTASGLLISYLPQDTSFLRGNLSDFAETAGVERTLFQTLLRKLDFPRVQFEKPMESYSAGQKKKVLLARSLSERAHLYVWDEPLNYVDVLSRVQIEELILRSGMTMLLVEHDRAFLDRVVTGELALGGAVRAEK